MRGDGNAKLARPPTRAEFAKTVRDGASGLSAVVRLESLDEKKSAEALRRLGEDRRFFDAAAGDTALVCDRCRPAFRDALVAGDTQNARAPLESAMREWLAARAGQAGTPLAAVRAHASARAPPPRR